MKEKLFEHVQALEDMLMEISRLAQAFEPQNEVQKFLKEVQIERTQQALVELSMLRNLIKEV